MPGKFPLKIVAKGLDKQPQIAISYCRMGRTTGADTNLVNLTEASRRLGINYATLWRWIKKGKVAPVRLLGMPFLTLDQIESLKNDKNNQATEGPVA